MAVIKQLPPGLRRSELTWLDKLRDWQLFQSSCCQALIVSMFCYTIPPPHTFITPITCAQSNLSYLLCIFGSGFCIKDTTIVAVALDS